MMPSASVSSSSPIQSRPPRISGGVCSSRKAMQLVAEGLVGRVVVELHADAALMRRWGTASGRPAATGRRTAGSTRRSSPRMASRSTGHRVERPLLVVGHLGQRAPALEQLELPALHLDHLTRDAGGQIRRQPAGHRGHVGRSEPVEAGLVGLHVVAGQRLGEAGAGHRGDGVDPHADALELAGQHDRHRRRCRPWPPRSWPGRRCRTAPTRWPC